MGLLISQCLESGRAFTGPQIHLRVCEWWGKCREEEMDLGSVTTNEKAGEGVDCRRREEKAKGGAKMGIKDFLIG